MAPSQGSYKPPTISKSFSDVGPGVYNHQLCCIVEQACLLVAIFCGSSY